MLKRIRANRFLRPAAILFLLGNAVWALPEVSAEPQGEQVAVSEGPVSITPGINQVGIDLIDRVPSEENAVLSPVSISTAFAMVYGGARGETARQLGSVMHFPTSQDEVMASFASFLPAITMGISKGQAATTQGYVLGARCENNDRYGIVLSQVLEGSPAHQAGMRPNDLILTINGQPVRSEQDYSMAIESADRIIEVCWYCFEDGSIRSQKLELEAKSPSEDTPEGQRVTGLDIVNALWIQKELPVKQAYRDVVTAAFETELGRLDFAGNAPTACKTINEWIKRQTSNRIPSLFDDGEITEKTRLVLANTIYFRGEWVNPFPASQEDMIWRLGEESIAVPQLLQTKVFPYMETEDYQAIELKCKKSTVSMVLILPREKASWSQFRARLGTSIWREALVNLQPRAVRLAMPKFRAESRISLRDWYERKMPLAFSENADFRGISSSKLKISEAVHQAFVNVDEMGIEAGAATGIVQIHKVAAEAEFVADHPFVFLLWDRHTGTIVFLGQLIRPDK